MRIVIIGAGEVGFHVAKSLSELDYDITVVDHIDGKPWNYRLKNLRFVTRSENSKGARVRTKEEIFKIGLMKGLF